MAFIKKSLLDHHASSLSNSDTHLVVYSAKSFELYYTYDGIDVCGARVANEVETQISLLQAADKLVTKLSIVGYSLGGLISRYCIGLLYQRGLFDPVPDSDPDSPSASMFSESAIDAQNSQDGARTPRGIKPVLFTTFATPHVGVVSLGAGPLATAYNFVGSYALSYTSKQLFLKDAYLFPPNPKSNSASASAKAPLLQVMADPTRPFYKGLAAFESRVLYANIVNDHRTEWYTGGISTIDPYSPNVSSIVGPYIPGYSPIIIDTRNSVPLLVSTGQQALAAKHDTGLEGALDPQAGSVFSKVWKVFKSQAKRAGRLGAVGLQVVKLAVVVPVWFVAFLVNATYQTSISIWRKHWFTRSEIFETFSQALTYFDGTEADVEAVGDENTPGETNIVPKEIEEEEQEQLNTSAFGLSKILREDAGEALDRVMDAVNYQSHTDLPALLQSDQHQHQSPSSSSSSSASLPEQLPLNSQVARISQRSGPQHLPLPPGHTQIINNLNSLGWSKYPVHITMATHSHAAIVVRFETSQFAEGEKVVDHWTRHVFKL